MTMPMMAAVTAPPAKIQFCKELVLAVSLAVAAATPVLSGAGVGVGGAAGSSAMGVVADSSGVRAVVGEGLVFSAERVMLKRRVDRVAIRANFFMVYRFYIFLHTPLLKRGIANILQAQIRVWKPMLGALSIAYRADLQFLKTGKTKPAPCEQMHLRPSTINHR